MQKHFLKLTLLLLPTMLAGQPNPDLSGFLQPYSFQKLHILFNDKLAVVVGPDYRNSFVLYSEEHSCADQSMYPGAPVAIQNFTYRMLSLVGPIASYAADMYFEGGAHPTGGRTYFAYDIARKKPALLTDFFRKDDILHALRNDPFLKTKIVPNAKITSLDDFLLKVDGSPDVRLSPAVLGYFAFHHVRGNQVAVRISLPYATEAYRHFTEIGIYLPMSGNVAAWLSDATRDHRLMQDLAP
ncbi:MAG: hypothetical protein JNM27_21295 [Leptospirales bacterium]|nr:hypothetical protein [Leptospirales bacterium]